MFSSPKKTPDFYYSVKKMQIHVALSICMERLAIGRGKNVSDLKVKTISYIE